MSGPYIKIGTAAQARFADGSPVTTKAQFIGWHRERLAEAGDVARAWPCDLPVVAQVNHGRWIASCPNCQGPMPTHPEWGIGCCGDCGCIAGRVVFPAQVEAIETLLLQRPLRKTQNWLPSESVTDLMAENEAHGVTE